MGLIVYNEYKFLRNIWQLHVELLRNENWVKRFQDWDFPAYFDKLLSFVTRAMSNWKDIEKQ